MEDKRLTRHPGPTSGSRARARARRARHGIPNIWLRAGIGLMLAVAVGTLAALRVRGHEGPTPWPVARLAAGPNASLNRIEPSSGHRRAGRNPAQASAAASPLQPDVLGMQPVADMMRRTLGQRFLIPGQEISTVTGTLVVNGASHSINLIRTATGEGDQASMAMDGGAASSGWDTSNGATVGGQGADSSEASIIERLVLDSPDELILGQLRGASYYSVAQNVMPAGSTPGAYTGPLWDVVRLGEPSVAGVSQAQSPWRLYYINTQTGLLDRIVSHEGSAITADITAWAQQGGELYPSHITWSRNGQVVMDLTVTGMAFAAAK